MHSGKTCKIMLWKADFSKHMQRKLNLLNNCYRAKINICYEDTILKGTQNV